jgi:Flp pilus assembly pilin Flp
MFSGYQSLYCRLQSLLMREDGQDLVEYGLVAMLVSVGTVAGVRAVAAPLVNLINQVSTTVSSA